MKNLWNLDFTGFTEVFHLLSHSIFLIWPHFYDKFLEKYIRLIFLPHFTTTTYSLYHSRYGFWQVHFGHLILHMRHFSNVIIDIHSDLCVRMSHDILHNLWIDIVLTQSGTSCISIIPFTSFLCYSEWFLSCRISHFLSDICSQINIIF